MFYSELHLSSRIFCSSVYSARLWHQQQPQSIPFKHSSISNKLNNSSKQLSKRKCKRWCNKNSRKNLNQWTLKSNSFTNRCWVLRLAHFSQHHRIAGSGYYRWINFCKIFWLTISINPKQKPSSYASAFASSSASGAGSSANAYASSMQQMLQQKLQEKLQSKYASMNAGGASPMSSMYQQMMTGGGSSASAMGL